LFTMCLWIQGEKSFEQISWWTAPKPLIEKVLTNKNNISSGPFTYRLAGNVTMSLNSSALWPTAHT
jgi:hypothetical protein